MEVAPTPSIQNGFHDKYGLNKCFQNSNMKDHLRVCSKYQDSYFEISDLRSGAVRKEPGISDTVNSTLCNRGKLHKNALVYKNTSMIDLY